MIFTELKPIRLFAVVDDQGNIYGVHKAKVQADMQVKNGNIYGARVVTLIEWKYETTDIDFDYKEKIDD